MRVTSNTHFYPRSPCGERQLYINRTAKAVVISIHALLAESDNKRFKAQVSEFLFLSTLSLRRATEQWLQQNGYDIFLSTLSLRRATGGRSTKSSFRGFLSTLSLRRATFALALNLAHVGDFYPRSPCGERLSPWPSTSHMLAISIHALLAESDCAVSVQISGNVNFYPRSPCGERRCYSLRHSAQGWHFYPRSPCGERHRYGRPIDVQFVFLSTLSLRRATVNEDRYGQQYWNFYPRSPCGERLFCGCFGKCHCWISIHALLAESDGIMVFCGPQGSDFYPRSPCGERLGRAFWPGLSL